MPKRIWNDETFYQLLTKCSKAGSVVNLIRRHRQDGDRSDGWEETEDVASKNFPSLVHDAKHDYETTLTFSRYLWDDSERRRNAGGERRVNPGARRVKRTGQNRSPKVKPRFLSQLAATSFLMLFGFWNGSLQGYNAVALPSFRRDPTRPFDFDIHTKSLFSGAPNFGGVIGAFLSVMAPHRTMSKKWILIFFLHPMSLLWTLIPFLSSATAMIAMRVCQGFAGRVFMVFAQLYTTEVAHRSLRGFFLSTVMFIHNASALFFYCLGPFVDWKVMAMIAGILPMILLPLLIVLPESPVTLANWGKDAEALKSLQWLYGMHFDNENALRHIKEHHVARPGRHKPLTFREMLRYTGPFLMVMAIAILRQFTGYYAVSYFTIDIFEAAAGGLLSANVELIITGVVALIFTVISAVTVDKLGRRILAIVSSFVMCLMLVSLGLYFHWKESVPRSLGWVPLLSLLVYVAAFGWGVSSLLHLVMGELLPLRIKSRATGLFVALACASQFAVIESFGYMVHGLGEAATFWVYAAVSALLSAICFLALQETAGRSYGEIEAGAASGKRGGSGAKGAKRPGSSSSSSSSSSSCSSSSSATSSARISLSL